MFCIGICFFGDKMDILGMVRERIMKKYKTPSKSVSRVKKPSAVKKKSAVSSGKSKAGKSTRSAVKKKVQKKVVSKK